MPLRRLAALVPVLLAVIATGLLLPHSPSQLQDLVLAAGIAAPAIVLAAWVVLTPALFPGTLLAAVGGLAFGTVGGAALATCGAVLGGLAAFALARTLGRGPAQQLANRSPRLARLQVLLERRGFAAVLAARLTPGVPASGLYYAAGLSPVRYGAFTAAITIGAVVRTTPYVMLGNGLASGSVLSIALAAASVAIGGAGALLLVRRL